MRRLNLRHLRLFLAVVERRSVTAAARAAAISQSAVTQGMAGLERAAGGLLLERTPQGVYATERGEALYRRLSRAFAFLDPALEEISPRLLRTATAAQLSALAAMRETENFTLAARSLGVAQPTVHRAVTHLEKEARRTLFERTAHGMVATRQCKTLAQAARLCFAEIAQAEAELAEFDGRDGGRIVIGALPLSRSAILPRALIRFREARPTLPVAVLDGPYEELLGGLRRGEIDVMIGALRDPAPIGDVLQEPLFEDRLTLLARPGHPLAGRRPGLEELASRPWIAPRAGTPARERFDALFAGTAHGAPASVIESGSLLLMREMLLTSDHLGCISGRQAAPEVEKGLLTTIETPLDEEGRTIGLTLRRSFSPTAAQRLMLTLIRSTAREDAPAL